MSDYPEACEMCEQPCIVLVHILLNTGDPINMYVCTSCLEDVSTQVEPVSTQVEPEPTRA